MPSRVTIQQFHIMAIGAADDKRERGANSVDQQAALRAFLPPIRWIGTNSFLGERIFAHGAVDTLPSPRDPFHLVVFRQACLPQT